MGADWRLTSGYLGSLIISGSSIVLCLVIALWLGKLLWISLWLSIGRLRLKTALLILMSLVGHTSLITIPGVSVLLRISGTLGSVLIIPSHISFLSAGCGNPKYTFRELSLYIATQFIILSLSYVLVNSFPVIDTCFRTVIK